MRLRHNGRELLLLPGATDAPAVEQRLDRLLGAEFRARALRIERQSGGLALSGWVGLPTAARSQPDMQFWFVNGRAVRDRLLANAVRLGFRDVLYSGRHPSYVLNLTLDPRLVDVNAHPAKLELRFRDSRGVYDSVFRAIEAALADTRPSAAGPASTWIVSSAAVPRSGPERGFDFRYGAPSFARSSFAAIQALSAREPTTVATGTDAAAAGDGPGAAASSSAVQSAAMSAPGDGTVQPLGSPIAQLHGLYILAQNREGLIMVDTHAAHERVLYEQLKSEYDAASPAAQRLLEPLRIDAAEHEIDACCWNRRSSSASALSSRVKRPSVCGCARAGTVAARQSGRTAAAAGARTGGGEGAGHLDGGAHRVLGTIACRAAIRGQRR